MKCIYKTTLGRRTSDILRRNEGTSLVLVSIIVIIIITGVVILRVTTSSLWASADKQLNQDQAYELATSFGESLNVLIVSDNSINLNDFEYSNDSVEGLPNASITAWVVPQTEGASDSRYILNVYSKVGNAEYLYTATYNATGTAPDQSYSRLY